MTAYLPGLLTPPSKGPTTLSIGLVNRQTKYTNDLPGDTPGCADRTGVLGTAYCEE
jgi:hypothetical protein